MLAVLTLLAGWKGNVGRRIAESEWFQTASDVVLRVLKAAWQGDTRAILQILLVVAVLFAAGAAVWLWRARRRKSREEPAEP